jgi:hypothetical protein
MSTQYRLVQSGKTASGGCSAGQGSSEPVAPRIYFYFFILFVMDNVYVPSLPTTLHGSERSVQTMIMTFSSTCGRRLNIGLMLL